MLDENLKNNNDVAKNLSPHFWTEPSPGSTIEPFWSSFRCMFETCTTFTAAMLRTRMSVRVRVRVRMRAMFRPRLNVGSDRA